jgi:hypothetical protein
MNWPRPRTDIPVYIDSDDFDESPFVPEMSIAEVAKLLPKSRVFTWNEEPETRAGDIFVFRWARVRHATGDIIEFPDVYIEFTAHPQRHPSARYWYASFILQGIEKTEFMAYKAGSTTNPHQALDRDVPLVRVEKDPEQAEQEANLRYLKRPRPGKRERLRKAA